MAGRRRTVLAALTWNPGSCAQGAASPWCRKNASHEPRLCFSSNEPEQQLPDACCYFCSCCWHRGSYGLFTGSCFVSLCTRLHQRSSERGNVCSVSVQAVFVVGHWALSERCGLWLHRCLLCKKELVVPGCRVCPGDCLFVLKREEARLAFAADFASDCEPDVLLRSR